MKDDIKVPLVHDRNEGGEVAPWDGRQAVVIASEVKDISPCHLHACLSRSDLNS